VYFACYDRRWLVDCAKLERYTSLYNHLDDSDVLYFHDEQVWVIDLLLTIVASHDLEDDSRDWQAAYRDTVSDLEGVTCFTAHAHLYDIAPRLGMYELQDYAGEMFKLDAHAASTQCEVMVDAVMTAYNKFNIMTSTLLKQIVVEAWILGGAHLVVAAGDARFRRLMAEVPEFVVHLHSQMMLGSMFTNNPVTFESLCNECEARDSCGILGGAIGACCSACGSDNIEFNLLTTVRLRHLPVRSDSLSLCFSHLPLNKMVEQ
jgi:hypothetical protein